MKGGVVGSMAIAQPSSCHYEYDANEEVGRMRIERIDVQVLVWPLHDPPHWLSFAPAPTCSELVVWIHTDAGITGIGHVDSGGMFKTDGSGNPQPAGAALVAVFAYEG
jgi:hypothetical protein